MALLEAALQCVCWRIYGAMDTRSILVKLGKHYNRVRVYLDLLRHQITLWWRIIHP